MEGCRSADGCVPAPARPARDVRYSSRAVFRPDRMYPIRVRLTCVLKKPRHFITRAHRDVGEIDSRLENLDENLNTESGRVLVRDVDARDQRLAAGGLTHAPACARHILKWRCSISRPRLASQAPSLFRFRFRVDDRRLGRKRAPFSEKSLLACAAKRVSILSRVGFCGGKNESRSVSAVSRA